jgi:hypothetical protein
MGWWSDAIKSHASPWVFRELDATQACQDIPRGEVRPGLEYVHVHLLAMRLPYERRWASMYHCSLNSDIRLEHGATRAEFVLTTSPNSLRGITAKNLAKVAMGPTRLAGPVPYLGGDLDLEIGLFAIKDRDLVEPYLNLLESIGDLAGLSYVGPALSTIRPLKDGLSALAGMDDTVLEVGTVRTFTPVRTGVFAVLAKPGPLQRGCSVIEGILCWDDGTPVTEIAYVVFSIEVTAERADWRRLPAIASIHDDLNRAAMSDQMPVVRQRLSQFERTVLLSPDLISVDADKIIAVVRDKINKAMPASGQTATAKDLPDFADLDLFPDADHEAANRALTTR